MTSSSTMREMVAEISEGCIFASEQLQSVTFPDTQTAELEIGSKNTAVVMNHQLVSFFTF